MAQQARNLLYKPDDQSCSPRTQVKVEGEDRPAAVPSGLPTCAMALQHPHVPTQISYTQRNKEKEKEGGGGGSRVQQLCSP